MEAAHCTPDITAETLSEALAYGDGAEEEESDFVRLNAPSYDNFFLQCLLRNRPAIVSGASHCNLNREALLQRCAHLEVPVVRCNRVKHNDQERFRMRLADFASMLHKGAGQQEEDEECLYLKDWHLALHWPSDAPPFYRLPDVFADDWFDSFWRGVEGAAECDDYRFVYWGGKDSWTPIHHDVLESYSWSLNVCGRKRWLFWPPRAAATLLKRNGQCLYDWRDEEERSQLAQQPAKPIELVQEVGDAIFVPSGWYHTVFNEEETLSINHNWGNACNALRLVRFVLRNQAAARRELLDIRQICQSEQEYVEACENLLKANIGMDEAMLRRYLEHAASNAKKRLEGAEGRNLAVFSLHIIEKCLKELNK